MTKKRSITIERKSAWNGALVSMPVVIDDVISLSLQNGESTTIELPNNKSEFDIQVKDHTFHIKNMQSVKKIVLKFQTVGVSCSITYQDGHEFNALNKNPGASVSNTIWLILLLLFVVLPIIINLLNLGGILLFGTL